MTPRTILEITGLRAAYGSNEVLRRIDLTVSEGQVVAIIGHNGTGKSTLLRCVVGLKKPRGGQVQFVPPSRADQHVPGRRHSLIAMLRQGGSVFGSLTVDENLLLCVSHLPRSERSRRVKGCLESVPQLVDRRRERAKNLSGGQQRLLGLLMVLIRWPRVLLLDEPSAGLPTTMVELMFSEIRRWCSIHRAAAVVVEQKIRAVLAIADTACVLRNGVWSYSGSAANLTDERLGEVFL